VKVDALTISFSSWYFGWSQLRAACRARSKFISKLGIVLEEANETLYWLEIIVETNQVDPSLVGSFDEGRKRNCSNFSIKHKYFETSKVEPSYFNLQFSNFNLKSRICNLKCIVASRGSTILSGFKKIGYKDFVVGLEFDFGKSFVYIVDFHSTGGRFVYAIIENGGKQYRVAPGDVIKLEVTGDEKGAKIETGELLFLFNDKDYFAGAKIPSSAKVQATVMEQGKDKKILVFKKKKRKQYQRTRGHRQHFLRVKIESITW
jgi:large subunit ribosomal protein L21